MCYKGRIIGFTRNGVDKMKDSTMMLASFEKTADFLYDAAVQGKHDRLKGVSERIIIGQPVMVGTGMFDICNDLKGNKGRKEGIEMARVRKTESEAVIENYQRNKRLIYGDV